ncbi:MAG TPA: hypothetical protein VMM35_06850, partial [Longimicrobiales bacterium]|nr:hypothetical protein [Longimicrobiales bacterium]
MTTKATTNLNETAATNGGAVPSRTGAPAPEGVIRDPSLRNHYTPSQFRTEAWNLLKQSTQMLRRAHARGRDVAELRGSIERTLGQLRQLESYWAFPGVRVCAELEDMLGDGRYETLADRTAHVVRLLISHSYRKRDLSVPVLEENAVAEIEDATDFGSPDVRPYFEVLVVDDLDEHEAREVRESLLQVQDSDDEFVYDVVIVPSFEDAVIAVMFNHNIQSCVLRYSFPAESELEIPEL